MNRRNFIKTTSITGAGIIATSGINACVGTYKPKIINAIWNEKFVFDVPDKANRLRQLIRCGVMAPSGHNTQPWLFKLSENTIEIIPDLSRRLPIADSENRELYISLGAVLENIIISAANFGYNVDYEIEKNDKGKITIHLNDKINWNPNILFESMIARTTTRNEYAKKSLPKDFQMNLQKNIIADTPFYFTSDRNKYDTFIDYVKEGNRLLFGKKKFLDELKSWIRWNDDEAEEKLDGLYIRALGQPSTVAWLGKMLFNISVTTATQNDDDQDFINSASGLLFLFSEDGIKHWIEAGRKLERILIALAKYDLKYAFHNQPCQTVQLRKSFAKSFAHKGLMPQAAIRIGYSEPMPRSPRRKINDMILP